MQEIQGPKGKHHITKWREPKSVVRQSKNNTWQSTREPKETLSQAEVCGGGLPEPHPPGTQLQALGQSIREISCRIWLAGFPWSKIFPSRRPSPLAEAPSLNKTFQLSRLVVSLWACAFNLWHSFWLGRIQPSLTQPQSHPLEGSGLVSSGNLASWISEGPECAGSGHSSPIESGWSDSSLCRIICKVTCGLCLCLSTIC